MKQEEVDRFIMSILDPIRGRIENLEEKVDRIYRHVGLQEIDELRGQVGGLKALASNVREMMEKALTK